MTAFTVDTLPAGYALVGGIAVHVAELRKYTRDVRRFLAYAPLAEKLLQLRPRSPEWVAAVESCDCFASLVLTQTELGTFLAECAEELRAKLAHREARATQ